MAGVGRMKYVRFLSFNIFGGIGWVISMTLAGYYLGRFPLVQRNFEKVVIAIVLVSVSPVVFQLFKARRQSSSARA
jgi:membrane-associated protein